MGMKKNHSFSSYLKCIISDQLTSWLATSRPQYPI